MRIARTHFGLELHDTLRWISVQRTGAIQVRRPMAQISVLYETRYRVFASNPELTRQNRKRAIQRAEDWALQNGS